MISYSSVCVNLRKTAGILCCTGLAAHNIKQQKWRTNMKKVYSIILTLLLTVSLSACAFTKFNGSKTGNESSFLMSYKVLNTTFSQVLKLEKGDTVDFEVTNNSGSLHILLRKGEEEPVYEGTNVPTSSFQVRIAESGMYTASVTGKRARGSVSIVKGTAERNLSAITASYYQGQETRAYEMLQKSIFKNLLNNGWLQNLPDMEHAKYNYDTFTKYRMNSSDSAAEMYYCTFSADNGRCGYVVMAYDGDGLSRVDSVETPYLYDLQAVSEQILQKLNKTRMDLSSATAERIQTTDADTGDLVEGIQISDHTGHEYTYYF